MAIYDEQKALAQEAYQAKLKQNAQQKQAEIDRLANQNNSLLNKYNEQKPILKQEFTDNAQGAYINKLQQEKALPQALAAQGYNGGITESARIKLGTNYGNAYNSFNKDYNARLKGIDNNISDTQLAHQDLLSKTNSQYSMQDSEAYQYLQNNLSTILANEEARQLRKEESDRAYALQQQELAMRKAQTKSNEDRPRLSLEQAEKAYNYGTRTNGVMDTLKYYYGDDFG